MKIKIYLLLLTVSISVCSFAQTDTVNCTSEVAKSKDKFDDEITFGVGFPYMTFSKVVTKEKRTSYYLDIYTYSDIAHYGGKGVYILFTDGTKFVRLVEKVECELPKTESGYRYRAFISLTAADLLTFTKKTVSAYRLYTAEYEPDPTDAVQYKCYVRALIKAK